jgi:hypothetical protein
VPESESPVHFIKLMKRYSQVGNDTINRADPYKLQIGFQETEILIEKDKTIVWKDIFRGIFILIKSN